MDDILFYFDTLSKECIEFLEENKEIMPMKQSSFNTISLFEEIRKKSRKAEKFDYPEIVSMPSQMKKRMFGGEKGKPSLLMRNFPHIKTKMLKHIDEMAYSLNSECPSLAKEFIEKKIQELSDAFSSLDVKLFTNIYDDLPVQLVDFYVSFLKEETEIKEFYQCFVPMKTQKLIETTEVYPIEIEAGNVKLRVLDSLSPKLNMHAKLITDVVLWMCDIVEGSRKCKKNISIVDFNMEPKLFPSSPSEKMGRKQINSGFTSFTALGKDKAIVIFRYEELIKVLIHELIHSFLIDRNLYRSQPIINYLKDKFPNISHYEFECDRSQHNILLGETFVEGMAHIFYCIFLAKFLKKENLFHYFIKLTIQWGLFQTAKILEHYGFDSFEEFLSPHSKKVLLEGTNINAYYIIRSALLFNIAGFYRYFLKNCKDEKDIKTFLDQTPGKIPSFIDFVDESLNDKDFRKIIAVLIKKVKKEKNTGLIWRTLRASPFVVFFEPFKKMYI
jgi:hypothetical protein